MENCCDRRQTGRACPRDRVWHPDGHGHRSFRPRERGIEYSGSVRSRNSGAKLSGVLVIAAFLLSLVPAAGQTSEELVEDPGLIITTESNLVIVPLHVYKGKKSVDGLDRGAFELLENGVRKEISFVEGPGSGRTVPVEIILLLDVSHSVMRPGLIPIQAIRNSFLKGGLREDVAISVYGFAGKLTRFTGPTRNISRIERAFELAYDAEDRQSRVFEATIEALRDATSRGGNASRMLVVISDGLSTTKLEPVWVVRAANLLGVPVYPVVLGHRTAGGSQGRNNANIRSQLSTSNKGKIRTNQQEDFLNPRKRGSPTKATVGRQSAGRANDRQLRQLKFADIGPQTGGRSFDLKIPSGMAMRSILTSIATLAQTEYIVGYYPSSSGDEPTEREIVVRLRADDIGKVYGGKRVVVN